MSHAKSKAPAGAEQLTRREREILNAVFALDNQATAELIRERLVLPPANSAVRVMLKRLEEKGHLRHRCEGLRFIYSATASPRAAQRSALRHHLNTFFSGSLRQMALALVAEADWDDLDLAALKAEIDRVQKQRRKP